MSFITLTTDFGTKDHSVAAVKGAIYSKIENVKVVDITHEISPFNITEAAYIIKNSYKNFPKNTIHIIGVDSELSSTKKHIVLELDGHFFICPDNGIISLITSDVQPTKIINIPSKHIETSFAVLDVFVDVAKHISVLKDISTIGQELFDYKKITELKPVINLQKNTIIGAIIYIDNYGNLVTNIRKEVFLKICNNRAFEIKARTYIFTKINSKYNDIAIDEDSNYDGKKLAIFNNSNFLELAIYKSNLKTVGGASSLLGLNYRDKIVINFTDTITEDFTEID